MIFDLADILPALPEMILATLALVLVLVAAYGGEGAENARRVTRIALSGIVLALILTWSGTAADATAFGGMFKADSFASYMKILVLLGTFGALYMSITPLAKDDINKPEFALLVVLALVGMMLMISANDLMSLYMAVELQSLPLYVVAAMRTKSLRSSEAGLKYFLLGALSSGMLLYGASLVYGFAGTTSFDGIANAVSSDQLPSAFIVGMVFMISGIAFKVSAAPFHMWTPDVYEGAPTSITSYFAVVPKVAGLALLIKFMFIPFSNILFEWQTIIIFISLASMILGAVAAMVQNNFKRLLAYSSIGHIGYALAGVATGSISGYQSSIIYISIYVIMNIGAFSCLYLLKSVL